MVVLVIPVKRLEVAKTRLDGRLAGHRRLLALAFATDTVAAALSAPGMRVLVVTDDVDARAAVVALGADVVADEPDAGLNPALAHAALAATQRYPGTRVGALSADLPALRPDDLAAAVSMAGEQGGFVTDVSGQGTTLLLAPSDGLLRPRFGPRSAAAHRADGLVEIDLPLPSLRQDVDTQADLDDAVALGVGPRTASLLADLDR